MSRERPVALMHSYLADREGKDRPDRLTRIGILAAAELYRHGEIDKICITVEPQLSNPQVGRLRTLLNNPPEKDIVVDAETVTTEQELRSFGRLAEENGWTNLITIANHSHLPRIRGIIEKIFARGGTIIEAKSSREILSQYPRYFSILGEMEHWPEQKTIAIYERILGIPGLETLASKIGSRLKHIKVILQSWIFNQLEKK